MQNMAWLSPGNYWLFSVLGIFTWNDLFEISVITLGIYYGSRWLATDKRTHLLPAFYGYALLFITSYYLHTHTLTMLAMCSFPIIATIFFLVHQQTLQKNFIALKKSFNEHATSGEWLSSFMRSCLIVINQKNPIFVLFERKDNLDSFVHSKLPVNTTTQQELLDALMASTAYHPQTMIWVTSNGLLKGLNSEWQVELDQTWLSVDIKKLDSWKQHALFITAKTDALLLHIEPTSRQCTIITQGKAVERLRLEQAMTMLNNYVGANIVKGEFFHAQQSQQRAAQRTP